MALSALCDTRAFPSILPLHLFASAFKLFLSPRNSHHGRLGEKALYVNKEEEHGEAYGQYTHSEIEIAVFTDTVDASVLIVFAGLFSLPEDGGAVIAIIPERRDKKK